MKSTDNILTRKNRLLALVAGLTLLGLSGSARAGDAPADPVEDQLGVKVEGVHLSAAGYMIDIRYRLIDPAKAAPLLDRKINPYLLDEATGARLGVPEAPKVGQLRPTSRSKVIPGRNYYILFANPGRYLKAGSKVTLVAGDARIGNLVID